MPKNVLHSVRFEIEKELVQSGRIKTGDIFFRNGNETFYGIPFSSLVTRITKSKYSHASIALVENDEIYLVEVNLAGVTKLRLIDWLDLSAVDYFDVWRLCDDLENKYTIPLERVIQEFLKLDADYDLTFSDKGRFYCTESINFVYSQAGYPTLCEGVTAKELLLSWKYYLIFLPINYMMKRLVGASIPLDKKLICVGNDKIGLMSSPFLAPIYKYYNGCHYFSRKEEHD